MSKKLTTEQFIEKAIAVHGNRYDYSDSEYRGIGKKITIGCPVHGKIDVVAGGHIKGLGCNACYFDSVRKKAIERFLKISAEKHGKGRYDYSLVDYKNSKEKIKIVCREHGVFETTAYNHMNGVGCPGCNGPNYRGFIENADKARLTKKEFVRRSQKKHGNKYDYSLVEYKTNRDKVKIICPIHGQFLQFADNHMRGSGCQKCHLHKTESKFVEISRQRKALKGKSLIADLKKIHGDKYDYSRSVYKGWYGQIEIICPVHGSFFQTANHHKVGHGCPQCAPSGFDNTLPAILYYLEIIESEFCKPVYKIGITNRTVQERYCLDRDREKIRVLATWEYALGKDARREEIKTLRKHRDKAYSGESPLDGVGTSEMFFEDVLGLSDTKTSKAGAA